MLPLRYTRRWQIVGCLALVAVFVLALIPVFWREPSVGRWLVGADKWMHGTTFAILAVWFSGQYPRRSYWRIAVGLFAFGLAIEACQRLVAYRTGDVFDMIANAVGILIGLSVAWAGAGGWSLRIEQWASARRE